ncbi:MAG: exonuclease SbcCD subunit D [Candidatus Binatia bacterium]
MGDDTIRFLHTSDWHLGAPINWGPERVAGPWIDRVRGYRQKAIELIVRLAIGKRVAAMLVAGDIFDQPELPDRLKRQSETFLRERVVQPLRDAGTRFVLTPGTHDCLRGRGSASLTVLKKLAADFTGHVELLSRGNWGLDIGTEETHVGSVLISTHPPGDTRRGPWIEFLHSESWSRQGGGPAYRAFGDRHIFTIGAKGAWHPGAPLSRSTSADNAHSDVGPRFVLIVTVGEAGAAGVQRELLPVPETAILKKDRMRDTWTLFYHRDHEANSWRRESWSGTATEVVARTKEGLPSVGYVTLTLDRREDFTVKRMLLTELQKFGMAIQGSRSGIVSVWLKESA